ncbi:MAG: alpha/beta hydrolase family esterase, partial [Polyangiaceae bacterium]
MAVALASAVALPVGCSSSNSATAGTPDGGGDATSGEGGALTYDSNSPSSGCGMAKPMAGTVSVNLMFGGLPRTYLLHVPPGYSGKPTPLVINMHGFLSSAQQQEAWSKMDAVADRENFLVAYPNGAGSPLSWNAGDCCAFSDSGRDDVGFISAIIDDIGGKSCLALDRVYATGMSNGGFMSHRLACDLSGRIAAIGPVAGVLGIPPADCSPGRAIPVMEFHGDADPLVPYAGGSPSTTLWGIIYPGLAPPTFRSVADTISFWRAQDGCDATPQTTYSKGDATCQTY